MTELSGKCFFWHTLSLPQGQSLRIYNNLNKELIEYIVVTREIYFKLEFLSKVIFICTHDKVISDSCFV